MPPGQAPKRIEVTSLADYLDVMSRVVFQSGMSWKVVEAKWEGTREAFHDFDPERVASMTPREIDRLTEDTRVIRNRRKLEAVVDNANTLLDLDALPGGFRGWLRSHADYDATERAIRNAFRFLGPQGIYYLLYVVGEDVPSYEDWKRRAGEV